MTSERFSRQSFLGEAGQAAIERCVVGVVGLGGGGGHQLQVVAGDPIAYVVGRRDYLQGAVGETGNAKFGRVMPRTTVLLNPFS